MRGALAKLTSYLALTHRVFDTSMTIHDTAKVISLHLLSTRHSLSTTHNVSLRIFSQPSTIIPATNMQLTGPSSSYAF